ncbi:MAG: low molecular weight protein-tyrosine-phosphatase [Balneolaceae bacterium]
MNKSLKIRAITKKNPYKICFVCLGNICRSPTGEGIFQHLVRQEGLSTFFYIDSAGTAAYHVGEPANSKSRATAEENGIELHSKARRFEAADLREFDLVVAMDQSNLRDIKDLDSGGTFRDKIRLMRDFDPQSESRDVPDPYYGGIDGFQDVFFIVYRSCEVLLNELKESIDQPPS